MRPPRGATTVWMRNGNRTLVGEVVTSGPQLFRFRHASTGRTCQYRTADVGAWSR